MAIRSPAKSLVILYVAERHKQNMVNMIWNAIVFVRTCLDISRHLHMLSPVRSHAAVCSLRFSLDGWHSPFPN